jgi:hypothetical protein
MITTQHPITIGSVTANETTVSLSLTTKPTSTGIAASAVVIGQRFVRGEGNACTPIGQPIRRDVADVYALAATNPAIAAEVQLITESLGRLARMLDL